jgi:flavin-dependent dehydrogenase
MDDRSASEFEMMPLRVPSGHYDVVVLGGGLAGLSMGIQLKRQRPDTKILVAEKKADPPRDAAFKVGESSVEIGAHYYREVVGMKDHLEDAQLRKHGLRFFMPAANGDKSDITKRIEFCTPAHHNAYTHQIDRGRFERELFNRNLSLGNDAVRGFAVSDVEVGKPHKIKLKHDFGEADVTARWIVDSTGRGNFMRRKLGIQTETGHNINAAWIRLAGGLDWEAWGEHDEEWMNRMPERGKRLYSTTHLVDEGYWLWLIQLATGPISIGVCADPRFHPYEEINTVEAFINWMKKEEPQLGAAIDARRGDILDFLRIRNFSYASSQVFSKDRWTLAGEAFGFIDALYSPGSDFIGFTNTFGGELIKRELDGEDIDELVDFYNDFFFRLFEPTIRLYRDQYQMFGKAQVMVAKVVFDSLNYFTSLGSPFVHGVMAKPEDIKRLIAVLEHAVPSLLRMQEFLREWSQIDKSDWEGVSVLSKQLEPYIAAQEELGFPADIDEVVRRSQKNLQTVYAMATWIFHKAAENLPEKPGDDVTINSAAISLDPSRWESDGLFNGEGMSLNQAKEILVGIEEMDLEARGAAVKHAAPA